MFLLQHALRTCTTREKSIWGEWKYTAQEQCSILSLLTLVLSYMLSERHTITIRLLSLRHIPVGISAFTQTHDFNSHLCR